MAIVAVKSRLIDFEWLWRSLICAFLLFAGLAGNEYGMEKRASLAQLYADTRSGRADVVEHRFRQNGENYDLMVRWATGPFSWYQFSEGGSMDGVSPELVEAFPEHYAGPQGHTFPKDFDAANSAGHVRVEPYSRQSDSAFWAFDLFPGWWAAPAAGIAIALSILMLRTRDHHYANRWAWFWMFLSTPLGMIGYILLERRPFPPVRAPRTAEPMGGFRGFVLGTMVFPILFAALALAVGYLLS
ncbi:hypothetical protein ABGB12_15050 [Actinocorallia sp. B10E7]|uniref:hypothetical protein n=1 Tax=Actinocorallia sp. B10E7 TaxID=3153558 RepID=UPI00325F1EBC